MRSMPVLVFACYAAALSAATLPFAMAWLAPATDATAIDVLAPPEAVETARNETVTG